MDNYARQFNLVYYLATNSTNVYFDLSVNCYIFSLFFFTLFRFHSSRLYCSFSSLLFFLLLIFSITCLHFLFISLGFFFHPFFPVIHFLFLILRFYTSLLFFFFFFLIHSSYPYTFLSIFIFFLYNKEKPRTTSAVRKILSPNSYKEYWIDNTSRKMNDIFLSY